MVSSHECLAGRRQHHSRVRPHKALNQARENEGGSAGFPPFLPVYKIVLRRPADTSNPPDLKLEI